MFSPAKFVYTLACIFLCISAISQPQIASYKKAGEFLRSGEINREQYSSFLIDLRTLHLSEDSLRNLIPLMLEVAADLSTQDVDQFAQARTYEALSVLFANHYANYPSALKYTRKEFVALKELDGQKVNLGYVITGNLTRQMSILSDMDSVEQAINIAQQVQERVGNERDSLQRSYGYRQLCVFYSTINDEERGLKLCEEGLKDAQLNGVEIYQSSFYETLALILEKRKDFSIDSVLKLRQKSIYFSEKYMPEFNRVNYRNLAINYLDLGDVDEGLLYIKKSLALFKKYPWVEGERISMAWFAHALMLKGELNEAQRIADSIKPYLELGDHTGQLINLTTLGISKAYQRNISEALAFFDERDAILRDEFSEERQGLKEEYAVKYETAKKEAENTELQHELELFQVIVILAVVLGLSIILISVLLVQKSRKKRQIVSKEAQLLALKAEKEQLLREEFKEKWTLQKNELRTNINQLMMHRNRNAELMELVEELRAESANSSLVHKTKLIERKLIDYSNEDSLDSLWRSALNAYPNFCKYLNEHLSSRNNFEQLFCIMLVMDYSQEDIARALKRSDKAIKSLRYRVRKKLQIEEGESLRANLKSTAI